MKGTEQTAIVPPQGAEAKEDSSSFDRFNPIDAVIGMVVKLIVFYRELFYIFTDAVIGLTKLKGNQWSYTLNTIIHQIIFSGIDAFYVVSAIAGMVGGVVMVQLFAFSSAFEKDEVIMHMMLSIIIRELAPLLTALILIGRSGSAITIELGTMRLKRQHEALETMGINMVQYFNIPRIIGLTVSTLILNIYFVIVTIGASLLISMFGENTDAVLMFTNFLSGLKMADLAVCIIKGGVLGLLIALACIYHGQLVESSPTQIPQQTSAAIVNSYMLCYKFTVAISVLFYFVK